MNDNCVWVHYSAGYTVGAVKGFITGAAVAGIAAVAIKIYKAVKKVGAE